MATILSESVELFLGYHGKYWNRLNNLTSQTRGVYQYNCKWSAF
jgi:hypothetical protein